MLAISTQNQQGIFEKVLRGKDGRLYAVRFVITDTDGQIRGRVLSIVPVSELPSRITIYRNKTETSFYNQRVLNAPTKKTERFFQRACDGLITSPYFSSLDFFVSQMTRAPSGTQTFAD